jgi:hypothetical protein
MPVGEAEKKIRNRESQQSLLSALTVVLKIQHQKSKTVLSPSGG